TAVCKLCRQMRLTFLHPQRHVIHEPRIVAPGEPFRLRRDRAEHSRQVVLLGFGVIAEDMAVDPLLMPGMPDPDPHAAEFRAEVLVDRAQTVMPGRAAA